MIKVFVVVSLLVTRAYGYSSGAPPNACSDMKPGHPPSVASGPSPYGIELSATQYSAGGSLTVTLKGSQSFKGFLVQALPHNTNGDAIGSFEVLDSSQSGLGQTACSSNKGFTHTSSFSSANPGRDEIVLKWSAPSALAGNIQFYATFVKVENEYWIKVPSTPVWDGQSDKPTTAQTTTATTVAPSSITDPPALTPTISADGCGGSKGCYSDCKGDTCSYLVTWKKQTGSDKVDFEIFANLEGAQTYVALGIAPGATMFDVSIIACTADATRTSKVEQFYAKERAPPTYINAGPINSADAKAAIKSGSPNTMSCRFTYDNALAKKSPDQWKDLDKDLYLFIARGQSGDKSLFKHKDTPLISPETVKLLSTDYPNLGGSRINPLLKAHACIMVVAWVFCASVGLILARYYKPMWANTKACGQKVWFSYHRALMLTAMFLTIIGFIIILVHQKGLFVLPQDLPFKAHPILGLIAIICALLNPLIAAFRCSPDDSKRPIFNWVHWFFGTVAHVFAIVAIFLGMLFTSVNVPGWITYVMMAFCLFHVCVEFILEIHQCCMYDKNRDRQEEYAAANKDGSAKQPEYAGRGFKCAMLIIYMIIVTIITIVLVAVIAAWGSVAGTTA